MTRFLLSALLWAATLAHSQEPPEEDVSSDKPKEYTFNPLQAAKELKIGNYYFKKGSYRAAAGRFVEATKWDANEAEAWLRLGDAHARSGKPKDAREAWARYLALKPEGKESEAIRKKLASTN